jgi:peptidylprolyl isomerase
MGEPLNIEIPPDKAFGDRDPSKVRMIPLRKLGEKANEIGVGDVIELDDRMGIVRFIGSGRVQVDFNHKYAGKTLIYDANIVKKIENDDEKITNLVRRRLPIDPADVHYEIKDSELEIDIPEKIYLLDGLQIIKRGIAGDIFKFIPSFQNIRFIEKYPNSSAANASKGSDASANVEDKTEVSATVDNTQQKQGDSNGKSNDDSSSSSIPVIADMDSKKNN